MTITGAPQWKQVSERAVKMARHIGRRLGVPSPYSSNTHQYYTAESVLLQTLTGSPNLQTRSPRGGDISCKFLVSCTAVDRATHSAVARKCTRRSCSQLTLKIIKAPVSQSVALCQPVCQCRTVPLPVSQCRSALAVSVAMCQPVCQYSNMPASVPE